MVREKFAGAGAGKKEPLVAAADSEAGQPSSSHDE
jgi:hypothetical protein